MNDVAWIRGSDIVYNDVLCTQTTRVCDVNLYVIYFKVNCYDSGFICCCFAVLVLISDHVKNMEPVMTAMERRLLCFFVFQKKKLKKPINDKGQTNLKVKLKKKVLSKKSHEYICVIRVFLSMTMM